MTITQKIICYQQNYWSLENILFELRVFTIQWLLKQHGWSIETANELWAYITPKVVRAINSYKFSGKSFKRYMRRILHFQVRSFASEKINLRNQELHVAEILRSEYSLFQDGHNMRINLQDQMWNEPSFDKIIEDTPQKSNKEQDSNNQVSFPIKQLPVEQRYILLRALQEIERITDESLENISAETNLPYLQILALRQEVFSFIQEQLASKDKLRERRNHKYFRFRFSEKDPYVQQNIQRSLTKSLMQIRKSRAMPSFTLLSKITGIPRGTLGANIQQYRKKITENSSKNVIDPMDE